MSQNQIPPDTSLNDGKIIINNNVTDSETRLASAEGHVASTANPHAVTASQAGALTQAEADALYKAIGYIPAWAEITGKPTAFNPAAHKASHATTGADAIAPGDIGAATSGHGHAKLDRALDVETSQRTVYVSPTGSDSTGDGTSASPWATIQYAVDQARTIMQLVNSVSFYKVVCATGTYDMSSGSLTIPANLLASFSNAGQGGIWITSATGNAADVLITSMNAQRCILSYGSVTVEKVTIENDARAIQVAGSFATTVFAVDCIVQRRSASEGGNAAIDASVGSVVSVRTISVAGRRFSYGLFATYGSVIAKSGTQPGGSVAAEGMNHGGTIR